MKIEFVDLKAQYQNIKTEIDSAISEVIKDSAFIKGPYVDKFEKEFAALYGAKHCIGVGNGTDALYIVMKMLGIGHGDEVITTAHSWISTSETISQTGAIPVFVDVDEYFTIDTKKIEQAITPRTKAILPVHLYGQMAEIDTIKSICKQHDLLLIEDCAQAHFSEYKGIRAGLWGIAGTFSFFPGKNLGAYGDAGCILTNDNELAEKCRMYANHGALVKHSHQIEGINSRLDGIQAAILSVKLKYIIGWTKLRNAKATIYSNLLIKEQNVEVPKIRNQSLHSFHLYVLKVKERDSLRAHLKSKAIDTFIHYPTPLPLLPPYSILNYSNKDFPISSDNKDKIISIPIYPEIQIENQEFVVNSIQEFYK